MIYVARTRNGFTPVTRAQLFRKFKGLEITEGPFANLPEAKGGRWGQGLTKAKMAECQWLTPELVGQFEFLEWTADNHLRHSKFVGLREDKKGGGCRPRMSGSARFLVPSARQSFRRSSLCRCWSPPTARSLSSTLSAARPSRHAESATVPLASPRRRSITDGPGVGRIGTACSEPKMADGPGGQSALRAG